MKQQNNQADDMRTTCYKFKLKCKQTPVPKKLNMQENYWSDQMISDR